MISIAERLRREGEVQGKLMNARETAKELLLMKLDETQISKATKLPVEEVLKIKKELEMK